MANPEEAIRLTLKNEGGFQKNPNDHANWSSGQIGQGVLIGTKYGITVLDMPGVSIEDLTEEQAIEYYRENYWKPLYSQINDQSIANKLFDSGVLFGVKTAVRLLQISMEDGVSIVSDGVFGQETLSDVNQYATLANYRHMLIQHCINVLNNNPNDDVFVKGWINRINS